MANIIDSYSESNFSISTDLYISASQSHSVGQSITGNGSTIGSAVFFLKKVGSPTGTANALIYAHTGTFGTSSKPTGAALATSDNFDISTLTTSNQLITLNFSGVNQITLSNATNYVVVFSSNNGNSTNKVQIGSDSTAPTHAGNWSFSADDVTWTAQSTIDVCFYVNDNTAATTTSTSSTSSSTSTSTSISTSSTSSSTSTSTSSTSQSSSTSSTSLSTSSSSTSTSFSSSTSSTSTSTSVSSTSLSTSLSTSSTSNSTSLSTSSTSTSVSTSSTSTSFSTSTSTSTSVSSTSTSFSTTTTLIDITKPVGKVNLQPLINTVTIDTTTLVDDPVRLVNDTTALGGNQVDQSPDLRLRVTTDTPRGDITPTR